MDVTHVVVKAIKSPHPRKTYGARAVGVKIRSKGVTVEWEIYAHRGNGHGHKKA